MSRERLAWFIGERESIRRRKEAGKPWPWTEDPVLQRYRFCNVNREHDRVTVWIREQWREPYAEHPNLWLAMCVARVINWPDTLAAIGFPERWDAEYRAHAVATMRKRSAQGHKVYTGAYMLRGDAAGGDKPTYTVEKVLHPLVAEGLGQHMNRLPEWPNATLQEAHSWFQPFHGWGGFLAYEVVTDLSHTRYLRHAVDSDTWAHVGPGAARGLNRIHGRGVDRPIDANLGVREMRELLEYLRSVVGYTSLRLRDVEHSLCEFDKYERAAQGQGRPRSNYVPGRGY